MRPCHLIKGVEGGGQMKCPERVAFNTLSRKHRQVLTALETGRSPREVAEALRCDEASVARLHEAALRIFAHHQQRMRRSITRLALSCVLAISAGVGSVATAVDENMPSSNMTPVPTLAHVHGRRRYGTIRWIVAPPAWREVAPHS